MNESFRRRGRRPWAALLLGLLAALGGSAAEARDTEVFVDAHAAAESEQGQPFLLDVPFALKGETAPAGKPLKEATVSRASSGLMRSDQSACTSAFLDALKVLQKMALDSGANAIIDVVSVTRDVVTESDREIRCVAGTTVAHVALRAKLIQRSPPADAPSTGSDDAPAD